MASPPSPPWWRHEAVIAWSLILILPLGLFLMWKYAPWQRRFKWAWTFLVPLVWLFIAAGVIGEEPKEQSGSARALEPTATRDARTATFTPQLAPDSPTPSSNLNATTASAEEEEAREADRPSASPSSGEPSVPSIGAQTGLLYVYFLEVSLGDAIYIRTPTGEDVVIDGADSPSELSTFLDKLGEDAIDVVIASHPHADHIGGLPRVIRELQVGEVWTNGQIYTTNLYRELEAAIASSGALKHAGKTGDSFILGGVTFSFLGPSRLGSNPNDNSLVVRMDCGTSSFLFTGDAEQPEEDQMIVSGQNLDVDILKLGHHGSRTSTSSELILATSPILAIYSATPGNQYGHPHRETLDRLARAGVPVFGTGLAGETVTVATACDDTFSVSPRFDAFPSVPALVAVPSEAPVMPMATPRPELMPSPVQTLPPTVVPPNLVATPASGQGNCSPAYPTVCIPPPPPDLDCADIPYRRFTVLPPDPHGFDGNDKDGVGCESN